MPLGSAVLGPFERAKQGPLVDTKTGSQCSQNTLGKVTCLPQTFWPQGIGRLNLEKPQL